MSGPVLTVTATHKLALDLLEAAVTAPKLAEVWPALKADVEVLPRSDLERLCQVLAFEAAWCARGRLRQQFRARLADRRMDVELHPAEGD